MRANNFWLIKARERKLLRAVRWARAHGLKVSALTERQIAMALKNAEE